MLFHVEHIKVDNPVEKYDFITILFSILFCINYVYSFGALGACDFFIVQHWAAFLVWKIIIGCSRSFPLKYIHMNPIFYDCMKVIVKCMHDKHTVLDLDGCRWVK